ncbi:MAG: hypothetical protein L0332_29395 [Chloroflexi bacterium]|nr:hypothetical protein [Chloroflexota bacterium]MCI0644213.1 hypothetical protein [Chloroflexota bacterium]MCI0730817.1 hypothetical protein [Chloroflexota bacterium]
MSRKDNKSIEIIGVVIAAFTCIAAYLAIPPDRLEFLRKDSPDANQTANPVTEAQPDTFGDLTPSPESTAAPPMPTQVQSISLDPFTVPANTSEGIRFPAELTGWYTFRYVDGAYSTYPVDQIPPGTATWLTGITVFKNKPVQWDGTVVGRNFDEAVNDYNYQFSETEAEARAQGSSFRIFLEQGDYITLVAIDHQSSYDDNPGAIIFEVFFLPE